MNPPGSRVLPAFEGAVEMILRLTLFSASALAFCSSFAFADEARVLDPVEVTGLRPVEADRATVSVTVLTGEDLAVRLSPNPADQLRAVPGVARTVTAACFSTLKD
jgi:vitamin B12 transporter